MRNSEVTLLNFKVNSCGRRGTIVSVVRWRRRRLQQPFIVIDVIVHLRTGKEQQSPIQGDILPVEVNVHHSQRPTEIRAP